MSFFKQFKFDKIDRFWIIYNISLPGPFDPPDNSLPRRNITALSYSWTTYHKHHTTEYLFYVKFWCLYSGSFIENMHIQSVTNTILLSICLCQIKIRSFNLSQTPYYWVFVYIKFWCLCPGSFIENTHIQSITNTILLSICLCQILVPSFRIIHRKYAHSICHQHHTTEYLFYVKFWCLHSRSFIENTHIQSITNTILLCILVPLSWIIYRKYA